MAKTREFVVEITWDKCDPQKVLVSRLKELPKKIGVRVAGHTLRLSSTDLEKLLSWAQTTLRSLEEAGCEPTFRLSTHIPSEPTVIGDPARESNGGRR